MSIVRRTILLLASFMSTGAYGRRTAHVYIDGATNQFIFRAYGNGEAEGIRTDYGSLDELLSGIDGYTAPTDFDVSQEVGKVTVQRIAMAPEQISALAEPFRNHHDIQMRIVSLQEVPCTTTTTTTTEQEPGAWCSAWEASADFPEKGKSFKGLTDNEKDQWCEDECGVGVATIHEFCPITSTDPGKKCQCKTLAPLPPSPEPPAPCLPNRGKIDLSGFSATFTVLSLEDSPGVTGFLGWSDQGSTTMDLLNFRNNENLQTITLADSLELKEVNLGRNRRVTSCVLGRGSVSMKSVSLKLSGEFCQLDLSATATVDTLLEMEDTRAGPADASSPGSTLSLPVLSSADVVFLSRLDAEVFEIPALTLVERLQISHNTDVTTVTVNTNAVISKNIIVEGNDKLSNAVLGRAGSTMRIIKFRQGAKAGGSICLGVNQCAETLITFDVADLTELDELRLLGGDFIDDTFTAPQLTTLRILHVENVVKLKEVVLPSATMGRSKRHCPDATRTPENTNKCSKTPAFVHVSESFELRRLELKSLKENFDYIMLSSKRRNVNRLKVKTSFEDLKSAVYVTLEGVEAEDASSEFILDSIEFLPKLSIVHSGFKTIDLGAATLDSLTFNANDVPDSVPNFGKVSSRMSKFFFHKNNGDIGIKADISDLSHVNQLTLYATFLGELAVDGVLRYPNLVSAGAINLEYLNIKVFDSPLLEKVGTYVIWYNSQLASILCPNAIFETVYLKNNPVLESADVGIAGDSVSVDIVQERSFQLCPDMGCTIPVVTIDWSYAKTLRKLIIDGNKFQGNQIVMPSLVNVSGAVTIENTHTLEKIEFGKPGTPARLNVKDRSRPIKVVRNRALQVANLGYCHDVSEEDTLRSDIFISENGPTKQRIKLGLDLSRMTRLGCLAVRNVAPSDDYFGTLGDSTPGGGGVVDPGDEVASETSMKSKKSKKSEGATNCKWVGKLTTDKWCKKTCKEYPEYCANFLSDYCECEEMEVDPECECGGEHYGHDHCYIPSTGCGSLGSACDDGADCADETCVDSVCVSAPPPIHALLNLSQVEKMKCLRVYESGYDAILAPVLSTITHTGDRRYEPVRLLNNELLQAVQFGPALTVAGKAPGVVIRCDESEVDCAAGSVADLTTCMVDFQVSSPNGSKSFCNFGAPLTERLGYGEKAIEKPGDFMFIPSRDESSAENDTTNTSAVIASGVVAVVLIAAIWHWKSRNLPAPVDLGWEDETVPKDTLGDDLTLVGALQGIGPSAQKLSSVFGFDGEMEPQYVEGDETATQSNATDFDVALTGLYTAALSEDTTYLDVAGDTTYIEFTAGESYDGFADDDEEVEDV